MRARMAIAYRRELPAMLGRARPAARHARAVPRGPNVPRRKMDLTRSVTGLLPLLERRIFSACDIGSFKPVPGLDGLEALARAVWNVNAAARGIP